MTTGKPPEAQLTSVNISDKTGVPKTPIPRGFCRFDFGLEGDAHAGPWHRQVSLLAEESIAKMRALGLEVGPGSFGENLDTRGIDLVALPIGTRLAVGEAVLEVTQIGKECHDRCAIYYQAGDCIMPREGIFTKVLRAGLLEPGMSIAIENAEDSSIG